MEGTNELSSQVSQSLVENSEDEYFQKLYLEGLKHSGQKSFEDTNIPVPKFYSKVILFLYRLTRNVAYNFLCSFQTMKI